MIAPYTVAHEGAELLEVHGPVVGIDGEPLSESDQPTLPGRLKTLLIGKPRDLQVEQALACIDFSLTNIKPVVAVRKEGDNVLREKIFDSDKFRVSRFICGSIFTVGEEGGPVVLVGLQGEGEVQSHTDAYPLSKGEVMLLPASVGPCRFVCKNEAVILEVALPEKLK